MTSLRQSCIEAMMRAEQDAGFLTDPTAAEVAFDALLSTLTEHADEWRETVTLELGGIVASMPALQCHQSFEIENWIAVLGGDDT